MMEELVISLGRCTLAAWTCLCASRLMNPHYLNGGFQGTATGNGWIPPCIARWRAHRHAVRTECTKLSRILSRCPHAVPTLADAANHRGHLVADVQSLAEISNGQSTPQTTNLGSGKSGFSSDGPRNNVLSSHRRQDALPRCDL